ncbi:MAG: FmdB family zinc ribbon protein [Bryobacteraceae bacterium]
MPLYEYECKKCGSVFEVLQKVSDAPLTVHDGCGGRLEKLLSPPAFQFKGSGWYITDYAGKSAKGKARDSAPPGESKSGDGKSGTDGKPAADSGSSKPVAKTK